MSLHCPSCQKPLRSVFYEGVKADYCAQCKGFFLSPKSLRQIEETREVDIPRDAVAPVALGSEVRNVPRSCPRCRVEMKQVKYGKIQKTVIDLCDKCKGLWLDRGELERIQLDYETVQDNIAANRMRSEEPAFRCPKCSHAQDRGEQCSACGIVFAKYEARHREQSRHEEKQAETKEKAEQTYEQLRGFAVHQQHHVSEAVLGFERANRYRVTTLGVNTGGYWSIEESNRSGLSILGRNLFGALFTFTMDVFDGSRVKLLHLERRSRLYFHELDVFDENGTKIGRARRRFSFFHRVISVENPRGVELLRIVGPVWKPWTFRLLRRGKDAGSVVKKWSGLLREAYTDADDFSMRFKPTVDTRSKRLMLGAMMLVDSLYFEGKGGFSRHFFSAPGVQIAVAVVGIGFMVAMTNLGQGDLSAGFGRMAKGWLQPDTPLAAARTGKAIRTIEFEDLLDRGRSLAALALPRQYTVMEVYLDTCPICRRLEAGFEDFLEKRPDVSIRKIHFPEGGLSISFTGSSQAEVDAKLQAVTARMDSYQICGTPHVEVYGPSGEAIAKDVCGKKDGTRFLRRWMATETGLSVESLLTSAGENASTALPTR